MRFLSFIIFVFFIVGINDVFAAETLVLSNKTQVYRRINGAQVRTLPQGTSVDVLAEKSGWLKIEYRVKDKKFIGYILANEDNEEMNNDVDAAEDEFEFTSENEEKEKKMRSSSVFFSGIFSFGYQGERDLQTTPDTIYDLSVFTGTSFYFELGWRKPVSPTWNLNLSFVQRSLFLAGEAKVRDSVTNSKSNFELTEKGMGLQVGGLYQWNERWSLIGLVELTQISSIELEVVNGTPINDSDIEKPFHVILLGGFTYQKPLDKNWSLEFQLRGGSFVTTDPITLILETGAQLHYLF